MGRIDTFDGEDALPVEGIHTWDKDNGDATFMHGVPDWPVPRKMTSIEF